MSNWLDPVRAALDRDARPVTLFVRDDDAGWEDERLYSLLDIVTLFQMPMDLAAIPTAIGTAMAAELRTLVAAPAPAVLVHQHGYAHLNHETLERKSEFGPSRPRDRQRQDLTDGRRRLEDVIGGALPAMFTPPWNRCTRDTAECLTELGVQVLSRDASAEPFGLGSLRELPISLDWTRGLRSGPVAWGERIAQAFATGTLIGFMLHHAVMTADDHRLLIELFDLIVHSHVAVRHMFDIATTTDHPGGLQSCV
jgi:hypothetical protein